MDLATINWIIFWIDTDLDQLTESDVNNLKLMFRAMKARHIRKTFDLKGDGSPHKLPLEEIKAGGKVDVDGRRGWYGIINLAHWFGKGGKRLNTLDLHSISWRCLVGCIAYNEFRSLTIHTYHESEFERYVRLIILAYCRRFDVQWRDANQTIMARWTKTQKIKSTEIKRTLVISLPSVEHADYLAKFLSVHRPDDFSNIDIRLEKSDKMHEAFVEIFKKIRKPLQPFERYIVHEIVSTDDVSRSAFNETLEFIKDVNRISVDGPALNVKLSTIRFVELPAGEWFLSIDLQIAAKLPWSVVLQYGSWLMQCTLVEYLLVLDHGAGIVACGIELAALDAMNTEGETSFN